MYDVLNLTPRKKQTLFEMDQQIDAARRRTLSARKRVQKEADNA